MCIRDRLSPLQDQCANASEEVVTQTSWNNLRLVIAHDPSACLLYTSDAADERSSVDLGGRRIIKKKKRNDAKRGRARDETNTKPTEDEATNRI